MARVGREPCPAETTSVCRSATSLNVCFQTKAVPIRRHGLHRETCPLSVKNCHRSETRSPSGDMSALIVFLSRCDMRRCQLLRIFCRSAISVRCPSLWLPAIGGRQFGKNVLSGLQDAFLRTLRDLHSGRSSANQHEPQLRRADRRFFEAFWAAA